MPGPLIGFIVASAIILVALSIAARVFAGQAALRGATASTVAGIEAGRKSAANLRKLSTAVLWVPVVGVAVMWAFAYLWTLSGF